MVTDSDTPPGIDERALRSALTHLTRWHWIATGVGFLLTLAAAFLIVAGIGQIDAAERVFDGLVDRLPFVTTERREEVVQFVLGAFVLLVLTNIGMGIASDIARTQVIGWVNRQPNPVAMAEAMKNRLRARSGRLEQQYRFFPKHAAEGKLQPNGLYVGIGTISPFWILMVIFFVYFRW